ncbi:Ig-like domain-containing protein [Desulfonema magnum]|uniref:Bacterial Ig-like domain-containing protein n=1 Tax=Desulfonema magnum TaxID=45655 RepID=A0A975GMQ8_9BACT|nr:Ig-like domain-containing protein [Desulfonema magnum]QTA86940.1 Bacterial Ig-like domain-containing protein [Desulfonema magnum]
MKALRSILFSLNTPCYIKADFTTRSNDTEYHLTLYREDDQHPIDATVCPKNALSAFIEVGLTPGCYYLKTEYSGDRGYQPFYTITINESDNTRVEIESNNTLVFANALDSSHPRQGRIYSDSDVDYYGFSVPEEMSVLISFTSDSETADYEVSITNGEGTPVYSKTSADGEPVGLERTLGPGNYYIKIEPGQDIDPASFYHLSTETTLLTALRVLVNIRVSAHSDQVNIDETLQLNALGTYSDASQEAVSAAEWSSSDEHIAGVDENGIVTGISDGHVIIYASAEGQVAEISLKIGTEEKPAVQTYGNLILVAGGGLDESNTLKESTQYLADTVYLRFIRRGFEEKDICYFNPEPSHDIDNDGYDDPIVSDDTPTADELYQVIETWAAEQSSTGPLYLVLINHGGIDTFEVYPGQLMTAGPLNDSLSIFQKNTDRDVVVLIEACKSGSFTDDLAVSPGDKGSGRMIITCTGENDAYLGLRGRMSFTQFFMDRLYSGETFGKSFNVAKEQLKDCGTPYSRMNPKLEPDGIILKDTYLVSSFQIASLYPEIIEKTEDRIIDAGTTMKFSATISDISGRTNVWAVLEPPNYAPPALVEDLKAPEVTLPTVELTDEDKDGFLDGVFTGKYENFICKGKYRIIFYARNADGLVAVSSPTTITVPPVIDYNNNGLTDIGDAIMVMRSLAGISINNISICNGEINRDGKIGLEEVVCILKKLAGSK